MDGADGGSGAVEIHDGPDGLAAGLEAVYDSGTDFAAEGFG